MRFKKLDLNLLVALDHLMEHRSVTAAADRMFMSQSAMSNALTRLRTYFDDPLLVQVGRRMELTPRAESLQPAIRDILVRVEATIATQPQFDPSQSGREFNLLLSDYSLRVLMPSFFGLTEKQNATVRFNFHAQTVLPHQQLEKGEVDVLITPEEYISDEHPSALLFEDHYVVVAWRGGRFAKGPLDTETYESAPHVIMVPPNQARAADGDFLDRAELARRVEVKTFSFSSLPHLITGTNRIATVHSRLARLIQDQAQLVCHPLPVPLPPFRQFMQWHVYRDSDPGIAWLTDVLQDAARALPQGA